ncbi:type II toxin-antitoxin system ParD family antitoxin [Botrimarina sp.]|uniref:ribbon-helix-helix domain-containing protein n=1 Tax=Botrimarina sp. TaxID=2795802 RepID=UPI0032EBCB0F
MTLNLPPDAQRFLSQVVASGRYSSAEDAVSAALRLLGERTEVVTPAEGQDSPEREEAIQALNEWTRRRTYGGHAAMDDSREAIYDGRGE